MRWSVARGDTRATAGEPPAASVSTQSCAPATTNVGISSNLIGEVSQSARDAYGIDLGTSQVPGGQALTVKDMLLKLDWNISDDHRASLRYSKTEQSDPIFPNFGATALSLSSNWYSQEKELQTLVGQWFADWTPTFSTEFKVSRREYDSVPLSE